MGNYRVIYEDPDYPDEPAIILVPSDNWINDAMSGNLPPISVYWELQDDEQKAIDEGRHSTFKHDQTEWAKQVTVLRIGKLSEEEAME